MRRSGIIILLALCACSPRVLPPITVYRDSVRVEVRERIVHDTVPFEVPIIVEKNVTKDTTSHLENDWAKSDAELKDGYLWHSLETKGKTVYVPVQVLVHDTLFVEKESAEKPQEVIVEKPLSWWQKARMRAFWPLLLALLAAAVYLFRKPILSMLRKLMI